MLKKTQIFTLRAKLLKEKITAKNYDDWTFLVCSVYISNNLSEKIDFDLLLQLLHMRKYALILAIGIPTQAS